MFDHDSGRPHPSLVDLAAQRAANRTIDPIQLHCRRPKWEPVTVSDPEAALRSTISQATDSQQREPETIQEWQARQLFKPTARTADMSGGIDQALEDAGQQGYLRGHADGLAAAVLCERIDWLGMGWIAGLLTALAIKYLPALLDGLDGAFRWLL
jgi:hypothetical protein